MKGRELIFVDPTSNELDEQRIPNQTYHGKISSYYEGHSLLGNDLLLLPKQRAK
jgi:hypothetical protein